MKILVGVPTAELARYAEFYDWLDLLEKPEIAGKEIELFTCRAHGQSPARLRNLIIQQAIDTNCDYVLFVDDDVLLPPDTLKKLLARDKDIVGGLYTMRNYPHQPIAFRAANDDGTCEWIQLNDSDNGLIEVVATGLGCLLVKIDVFKKIQKFGYKYWVTMGELENDMWCDDLAFFKRVRAVGFKSYIDINCPVGHIAKVVVWPNKIDEKWHLTYDSQGTGRVSFIMPNSVKLELVNG